MIPNNNGMSAEERNRMREAMRKTLGKKWAAPEVHEVIEKAKRIASNVFNLTMNVIDTAADAGHPYDKESASKLIEKLTLEAYAKWPKEEVLFMLCLTQTETTMERVDELVEQGLVGPHKHLRKDV